MSLVDLFKEYQWKKVEVELDGKKQPVEFPDFWNDNSIIIVAAKYFRMVGGKRETSFKQVVTRITTWLADKGEEGGYFKDDKFMNKTYFKTYLARMMVEQKMAFNSPVWFNVGVVDDPQCSACFILGVDDSMEDILENIKLEGMIYKGGSGAGCSLTNLRSSWETLSGGGFSSGPVSFMKPLDSNAGSIASGGTTRRAAAMRVLGIGHPDILEQRNGAPGFIRCKAEEEKKGKFLLEHGWSSDFDTGAYSMLQFQNANNSVGITDDFMQAVENDEKWTTLTQDGKVVHTYKARDLMREISKAAWECGDPGVMFLTTMNRYNPVPGIWIESTNPCVAPETQILINKGYKRISKLEGRRVKIWNGEEFSSVTVRKTGTNRKLYTVNLSNGVSLDVTYNHEFRIQKGFSRDGISVTKTTKELKEGDKLIKYSLPVIEGEKEFKNAYTHGFCCADGHEVDEGSYTLRLYSEEKKNLLEHLSYVKGSYKEYEIEYGDGTCLQVTCDDLNSKFKVPYSNIKIKDRIDWFTGLIDGDGHIQLADNNPVLQLHSINKEFLLKVRLMLQTLGIDSKVSLSKEGELKELPDSNRELKEYQTQDCYRLVISSVGLMQLYDLGLRPKRLKYEYHKPNRNASQFIKVVSVIDENRIDDTFCFTEPKRHTGMFNGVLTGQCGEFIFIPFSSCNLASKNLLAYYDVQTGDFDFLGYMEGIKVAIIAMDIIVDNAHYPDKRFKKTAQKYRNLGLGYTNLGALLMQMELAYGKKESQIITELLTSMLTFRSFDTSHKLTKVLNKTLDAPVNVKVKEIIESHSIHIKKLLAGGFLPTGMFSNISKFIMELTNLVDKVCTYDKFRNSQVTLLAPTGTISFGMGAQSTGIEPLTAATTWKKLVGGGGMYIIPEVLQSYLKKQGWVPKEFKDIVKLQADIDTFITTLSKTKKDIVRTAVGKYSLDWRDHANIVISAQKYLSGGISKTFNVPNSATPEDVEEIWMYMWKHGGKGVTVYRDGCKGIQVLNTTMDKVEHISKDMIARGVQRKLPKHCNARRFAFTIGQIKGYIHVGYYDEEKDGNQDVGELFIRLNQFGSTINGLLDAFGKSISYGLQYGVPLKKFVKELSMMKFDPQGFTNDPDIKVAPSIIAYAMRRLAFETFSKEELIDLNLLKRDIEDIHMPTEEELENAIPVGSFCQTCGTMIVRTGKCDFCPECNVSTGGCEP